jgi:hypothetical protein
MPCRLLLGVWSQNGVSLVGDCDMLPAATRRASSSQDERATGRRFDVGSNAVAQMLMAPFLRTSVPIESDCNVDTSSPSFWIYKERSEGQRHWKAIATIGAPIDVPLLLVSE